MQPVSKTYNPYTDERFVGISVTFQLIDLEAAGQATPSSNGAETFSDLMQLLTGAAQSPGKVMTMEDNLVQTDGTWDIMPDGMEVPFWSTAVSDGSGTFTTPPTLTMELSAPASSIGFSMTFDEPAGCWPSRVRITAYSGDTQLSRKEFANDGPLLVADMPVQDYDRVVVEFLKTPQPYRRIKLYGFLFGVIQIFDADTIVSATWQAGASVDCSAIPSRELVFTFDNQDRKYNFLNPSGLYAYLQDGQAIESYLIVNGERVKMGTHYYTTAQATDETLTAQITANDKVLALDDETYDKGQSGVWTLREAVVDILGSDAVLDMTDEIAEAPVGRAVPLGTTKREALRLVSQAARCACWMDRDGAFVFRDLVAGESVDTLDADNCESLANIKVTQFYDCVKLTVRDEFAEGSEPVEYTAGTGTNVKTYTNPCALAGQLVADWLLAVNRRRLQYTPPNRGNPALEVGDTMTIYNAYDEAGTAVLTSQALTYNGGLRAETEAVGA